MGEPAKQVSESARHPAQRLAGRARLLGAFAWAAARYWLTVFPRVASELRRWRRSAARIADPELRRLALAALGKRANLEGAGAFATFAPSRSRGELVRALVAFQAIYNYADLLAEQPSADPVDDARRLHQALLLALDPTADAATPRSRLTAERADGDYLAELIDACETASWSLPSYGTVAATACHAAARIVAFQSLSLSLARERELESWANGQGPTSAGFAWWEVAASAGSSALVHALIAAAASPDLSAHDVAALDAAYFPCIGALHSLLDSLVDEQEDEATGQLRLLDCYPSRSQAADGLQRLAAGALRRAGELPHGVDHTLLVTAMACSYLAAPEASAGPVAGIAHQVRRSLGPLARPMLLVFRLRDLAGRSASAAIATGAATTGTTDPTPPPVDPDPDPDPDARGADARAA